MSATSSTLDDVFAFCATDTAELSDVWTEVEQTLCRRDKEKPPRILVDLQHLMFREHGFELNVFVDTLTNGFWAERLREGGRLAFVIGTQQNVCVCGKLELLDALAEVADRSSCIHIMPTVEQALMWLGDGERAVPALTG